MSFDPIQDQGPPLRLDDNGIPILDQVIDEVTDIALEKQLRTRLLEEMKPQIQDLVHATFVDTMKTVALDMKRIFEQELDRKLRERLAELVDRSAGDK